MLNLLTHFILNFREKLFYILLIIFSIGYHIPGFSVEVNEFSIALSNDLDIEITQYPSSGKYLFIWPYLPNMGENKNQYTLLAKTLTDNGIEVWYCDIVTALFLTYGSNTLRNMSGKYVANLLKKAYEVSGKNIIVAGHDYAAVPILRGVLDWQKNTPKNNYLTTAILFSPKLYKTLPQLGLDPEYLSVVNTTTIPLIIFQGSRHGNAWQLPYLLKYLSKNNPNIHVEMMPNINSLFYSNELGDYQSKYITNLPKKILKAISLFTNQPPDTIVSAESKIDITPDTGVDSRLKPFKGNPTPHAIKLNDYNGKQFEIIDYKNRVTIINFWATWCKPCIEEIPSLNRLKNLMGSKPFDIISINFEETPDAIREFQKIVKIEFPVLLDTNGKISATWKVIAFPSTFIVASDGKIHYGVNAGIEWDTPQIVDTINSLF